MRIIAYTVAQMQSSVLVVGWQVVAPNGLLAAIRLKAGTEDPEERFLASQKLAHQVSYVES